MLHAAFVQVRIDQSTKIDFLGLMAPLGVIEKRIMNIITMQTRAKSKALHGLLNYTIFLARIR